MMQKNTGFFFIVYLINCFFFGFVCVDLLFFAFLALSLTMSSECRNAGRGDDPADGAAAARRPVVLDFSKVQRTPDTAEPCGGNVAPPPVDTPDGVQKRKSAGGDASAPPPLARQNAIVRPAPLDFGSVLGSCSDEETPPSGARAPRSPPGADQSPDCPPEKKRSCS